MQDSAALLAQLSHIATAIEAGEEVLAEMRADRDALIRDLAEQGFSEREIARASGTTAARVHQIKTKEATGA